MKFSCIFSDFKIREIGINHFYTVQCVLRINLFNEVIFIIQWFWLISISAGIKDLFENIHNYIVFFFL